jgi:uncharacterized protein (TIGR02594 family)
MPPLPPAYGWLTSLATLPRMVTEALKLFGTVEAAGAASSPTILGWADEVGGKVEDVYKADSIPWCGLFMAVVAKRAGKAVPVDPLWALNWAKFGVSAGQPILGDVLTFIRPGGGHVALYIGEDATAYHVLGGNQSDQVCFTRIAKSRLHRVRRPTYRVQPATVRPIILKGGGQLSQNEA